MFFWNKRRKKQSAVSKFQTAEAYDLFGCVVSDVGLLRPRNEDNYILGHYCNGDCREYSMAVTAPGDSGGIWTLAGVFDGMGGGEKGELAARGTADYFLQAATQIKCCASSEEVDRTLRRAFLDSNNAIVQLQQQYKVYGTTGTVLCTDGAVYKLYHLGDSRAYLYREGSLFRLTRDQTLAQMKLDVGVYREDDPRVQEEKHKLTEYIGRDRTCENLRPVESEWIPVQQNDTVLLCSDGLYDMCSDELIAGIMRTDADIREKCRRLVTAALEQGGEDNVTCVMVTFV